MLTKGNKMADLLKKEKTKFLTDMKPELAPKKKVVSIDEAKTYEKIEGTSGTQHSKLFLIPLLKFSKILSITHQQKNYNNESILIF